MKSTRKYVWGIILIILAAGLLMMEFAPGLIPFGEVSAWKWFVGAVLVYWLIEKLIFGKKPSEHFDFFLPLALLFVVFEDDIARYAGIEGDIANDGLIIGVALLLMVAFHMLLDGKSGIVEIHVHTHEDSDQKASPKKDHKNQLSGGAVYFDMSLGETEFEVSNRLGSLDVYFQNTGLSEDFSPVVLNVQNSLGETQIHVPANWAIENQMTNSLGSVSVDPPKAEGTVRTLTVKGTNSLGNVNIIY